MSKQSLTVTHQDILLLIKDGLNTITAISKRLKTPRSTVTRRMNELLDNAYVRKIVAANTRIYELSKLGKEAIFAMTKSSNTLERARNSKGEILKVHKVTWSAVISREPWKLGDKLKDHSFIPSIHKNWVKFSREYLEEDLTVVFNPHKVFFYIHEFFLESPMEYYPEAKKKVIEAIKKLQGQFPGLVLGEPKRLFTVHSQHVVKQGGPLARKFEEYANRTGNPQVYHGKRLQIDHSQGDWEEETVDSRTAPADMMDLGYFFDSWLETPFKPSDVREVKSEVQVVKDEVKVESEAVSVRLTAIQEGVSVDVAGVHTSIVELGSKVDGDLQLLNRKFSKNMAELGRGQKMMGQSLEALGKHQAGLQETQSGILTDLTTFSTAMHEHVQLIKAIQGAVKANQDGTKMLVDVIKEMRLPWYVKFSRFVRSGLDWLKKR